jgi:hypothetical protein
MTHGSLCHLEHKGILDKARLPPVHKVHEPMAHRFRVEAQNCQRCEKLSLACIGPRGMSCSECKRAGKKCNPPCKSTNVIYGALNCLFS